MKLLLILLLSPALSVSLTARAANKNLRLLKSVARVASKIKDKNARRQIQLISNALKGKLLSQKNTAEKKQRIFRKLKYDMGLFAYKNWKRQLVSSGIHLNRLSVEKLRELAYTAHDLIKAPRKLGLPLPQKPNAFMKMDINKMKGGALSVRFPNLPKVVIVNQAPYYSYNSNRHNRII